MIRTARVILRSWRPEDRDPFAEMGEDAAVMEHFRSLLTREESDAMVDRIEAHFNQHGFGLWAVEIPGQAPFAGFIGLAIPTFEASFTPCVEVGWRLARRFWGAGYATEGAGAALKFGFEQLQLPEIVSMAVPANTRSINVMKRIGMTFAEQFDHPKLDTGHRLRRHFLYRISRGAWQGATAASGESHAGHGTANNTDAQSP